MSEPATGKPSVRAVRAHQRRGWEVLCLVAAKELRESLRDRRTLAVTVLFPLVVYPLLTLILAQVNMQKRVRGEAEPSRVALTGDTTAVSRTKEALTKGDSRLRLVSGDRAALRDHRIDVLVDAALVGPSVVTTVYFDETREESVRAKDRLEERLDVRREDCPAPFRVDALSVAGEPQVGGYLLSKALPLFLVMMVMLGAFYPAIDTTAGERERQTLESLVVAPVSARWLLAGKLASVTVVAALAGLLHVASLALTLGQAVRLAGGTTFTIPWARLVAVLCLVPPAALMFAGLLVAVASHGRTFKEAQSFVTPVYLLGLVPGLVAGAAEWPLRPALAAVPIANLTIAARALLAGEASAVGLSIMVATTAVYAVLAVMWAERSFRPSAWFSREGEPASARRSLWGSFGAPVPASGPALTPGRAMGLFGLAFVFLYFGAIPLQRRDLVSGLLASEWLGIAGLTLLFLRLGGHPFFATTRLRVPRGRHLAGAALVGASAWIVVGLVTQWVLPVPKEVVESLRKAIQPADHSRSLAFSLFLMALTPAVCEEVLFRGAILRGLLPLGRLSAVLLTGALFGLFHVDVWRLLPTALLGVVLSWVAWRTDSLWTSILAHFINNGAVVVLAHLGADDAAEKATRGTQLGVFGVAAVILGVGVWLIGRASSAPSA